jgi:hypothetical protein
MNSANDRKPELTFQAGYAGSIPVARSSYLPFFDILAAWPSLQDAWQAE